MQFLRLVGRKDGLKLVDMAEASFDPQKFGLTMEQCVGSLRGFDSEGRPLDGVDSIRAMYEAVGLGWLMSWTKIPVVSSLSNKAYELFAHYRPRFSAFKPQSCETDRCQTK
jgi:predicted DCC family thiol-disulfide oxidoreductase YuxK